VSALHISRTADQDVLQGWKGCAASPMMADEPSHHLGRVFMSYMSQILRLSPEFSIAACTAGQNSLNARSISSVFPDVLYSRS
jgi:hypothetical protein